MPAISTFLIPNTRNYIHCNYFCLFSRFVQHLFHVFNPSECAQPQIGRSFKEPPAVRLQLTPCVICCCFSCSPAAAAKSLQLCPTPCNPIDGSPPGSPVPGILQARTLEWAAISFSNCYGSNTPQIDLQIQHSSCRIPKLSLSFLKELKS